MKLILNNKMNEAIKIDSMSRSLNIPDTQVLFDINFSTNNLADATSMSYLIPYATTPITAYALYDDDDNLIVEDAEADAKLISFNENFSNNFYNSNASIQVKEN